MWFCRREGRERGGDEAAAAVPEIRRRLDDLGVDVPIVGDFHYNGHLLLTKYPDAAAALAKYRINPGNVGGKRRDEHFRTIVQIAIANDKPVRIGVNWGSLDQDLLTSLMDSNARETDQRTAKQVYVEAMLQSALRSAAIAEETERARRYYLAGVDGLAELSPETQSIAHVLRAAGYHVALKGKWHLTKPLDGVWGRADTDRLGLGRPDSEPLATETLPEIIEVAFKGNRREFFLWDQGEAPAFCTLEDGRPIFPGSSCWCCRARSCFVIRRRQSGGSTPFSDWRPTGAVATSRSTRATTTAACPRS